MIKEIKSVEELEQFEHIVRFRKGSSIMAMNVYDYYKDEEGKIIKHHWENGGQSFIYVEKVPEMIEGYTKEYNTKNK
jgi:hypothetical protein